MAPALVARILVFFLFAPREVTRRQVSSARSATIWSLFEMTALILWSGMMSRPSLGQSDEYLPVFRVSGPMVGRLTEEPESNLRLAIFQFDDVSSRGEIY